jgi:HNH endonuclease
MAEKQYVPELLRRQTRERASGRCEYRLLHEDDTYLPHEIDHVIAEKHGGQVVLENLAWACASCNGYKGTDLTSVDPASGRLAPLFNPRRQKWQRHFHLNGARIEPLTATGRVTVRLLHFNDPALVAVRGQLIQSGRYPRR